MEDSILNSTKKLLSIDPEDDSYDLDIITYINSAFAMLHDAGIGPAEGFVVWTEYVKWDAYLVDDPVKLSKIKAYVYLRARLYFDPPTTGFLLEAAKEQLREVEWRLNINREATEWVDPDPSTVVVVDE